MISPVNCRPLNPLPSTDTDSPADSQSRGHHAPSRQSQKVCNRTFSTGCWRNGKCKRRCGLDMPRQPALSERFLLPTVSYLVKNAWLSQINGGQGSVDGVVSVPRSIASAKLSTPHAVLLVVPLKCPELNPAERTRQATRDKCLSNRVRQSCNSILDHCCCSGNEFVAQPGINMSIGCRQ
jgi:hypothetical protein